MNLNRIGMLSNLVSDDLKRKPIIILPSNREKTLRVSGTADDIDIAIDADEWMISDEQKVFVQEIAKNDSSIEEKILQVYEKLCKDYTYDDNVLSYIKKNDDDTFFLPDAYGRDTDSQWRENRKKHNRRNCFEISRILAESLREMFKFSGCSESYDVCIIWDEAVTHYLVGLASRDYYISLDLDDFTQIKDLTRLKTDLTLEGIKIFNDPSNKFESVLNEYNEGRNKSAKDYIEDRRNNSIKSEDIEKYDTDFNDIEFLQYAIQILREEYDIDSSGIFEYMKEIIDTKLGTRCRKKVWKLVENDPGIGKRYTRCLIVTIDDISYIIDVTQKNPQDIFREFNQEELENANAKFKRLNDLKREWDKEPYDGR